MLFRSGERGDGGDYAGDEGGAAAGSHLSAAPALRLECKTPTKKPLQPQWIATAFTHNKRNADDYLAVITWLLLLP